MKIIKPGKSPNLDTAKVTCSSCGCEFEFTREEGVFVGDQRDGDFYRVKCPQEGCGRAVHVSPTRFERD